MTTPHKLRQAHDELDSTPGAAASAEAELAQFHTLNEEYEKPKLGTSPN